MKLRDYQKEAVDFCLDNINKKIAICSPTASGKSYIAKGLADLYNKRVAIITYSNDLVRQFKDMFDIHVLVGRKHYTNAAAYAEAIELANTSKIVLFNAASYINYMQRTSKVPFDLVIIDEADSCLNLLSLQVGIQCKYPFDIISIDNIMKVLEENNDNTINLYQQQHRYWYNIEKKFSKVTFKEENTLIIRPIILSKNFINQYFPEFVVAMSGTLFKSHCTELFGTSSYLYKEIQHPIPVENRKIKSFTDIPFENSIDGMVEMLEAILKKYKERPVIAHVTYNDAKDLVEHYNYKTYISKDLKLEVINSIEGKDEVVFAPGATTGLDLKYDKARLNIILRGAFPNLGDQYVTKRLALEGGEDWYIEETLRLAVQASGRVCRTIDDYGLTIISDCRLTKLISQYKHKLPQYFLEALDF